MEKNQKKRKTDLVPSALVRSWLSPLDIKQKADEFESGCRDGPKVRLTTTTRPHQPPTPGPISHQHHSPSPGPTSHCHYRQTPSANTRPHQPLPPAPAPPAIITRPHQHQAPLANTATRSQQQLSLDLYNITGFSPAFI